MDHELAPGLNPNTFPSLERLVRDVDQLLMSGECLINHSQFDQLDSFSTILSELNRTILTTSDLPSHTFVSGTVWRVIHKIFNASKKWLEYWSSREDHPGSQSVLKIIGSVLKDVLSIIKVACASEVKDQFLHSWNLFLQDTIKYDRDISSFPLLQPFTIFQASSTTTTTNWQPSTSIPSMILQRKIGNACWSSLRSDLVTAFSSLILQKSLRIWIGQQKWLPSSDFSALGKIQRSTLKVLRVLGIAVQQEHCIEDWSILASLLLTFLLSFPLRRVLVTNRSVLQEQTVEVLHMFLQICFEASAANSKGNSQLLQQDFKAASTGTYELSERAVAAINLILVQSKQGLLDMSSFDRACLAFRGRWLTPLFGPHRDLSDLARSFNNHNSGGNGIGKSLIFLYLQLSRANSNSRVHVKALLVLLSHRRTTTPILLLEEPAFVSALMTLLAVSEISEERDLLGKLLSSQILHLSSLNEPSVVDRQLLVGSLNISMQLLSHSSHTTRAAAAEAIGSLRQSSLSSQQYLQSYNDNLLKKLITILLEASHHETGTVRCQAIGSVGDLTRLNVNPWSMDISKRLEDGLRDAKLIVRIDATWAFSKYIMSKWIPFIIKESANVEVTRQEAERWSTTIQQYLIMLKDSDKLKAALLRGISGLLLVGLKLQQFKVLTLERLSIVLKEVDDRLLFSAKFTVDDLINARSRDSACAIALIFCSKQLLCLTQLPHLFKIEQLELVIKMLDIGFPQLQVLTAQQLCIILELMRRSKISLQPILQSLTSVLLRLIDPNQDTRMLLVSPSTNNTVPMNTEILAVNKTRQITLYRLSLLLSVVIFQQVSTDDLLDHAFLTTTLKHHLNGFVNEVEPKCKRAQSFQWRELMSDYELFSLLQLLPSDFLNDANDRILGRSAANAILGYLYRDRQSSCGRVQDSADDVFVQSSSITNQVWSSSLLLRLQSLAEQPHVVQQAWNTHSGMPTDPNSVYSSFSGLSSELLSVAPPSSNLNGFKSETCVKFEKDEDPDEI